MFKSLSVLSDCLRPNGLQLASILKITADGNCSCKIKTLAPWKSYDQPKQLIKKQTLLCQQRKVHLVVKAMVFPVIMYGYET